MEIGIIGFGRFGQLLVQYLSEDFSVSVSSRSANPDEIKSIGGIPASFGEVCQKDMVIPSVPISKFEDVVIKMIPYLSENLVVDVCSVKEYPVSVMQRNLPESVQILATHPMFGPDSASNSIRGQKIVLSKIRIGDTLYGKIKEYLISKELQLIETTPENHDRQIARSQVLTHFIGRGLSQFGAGEIDIDTEGYKRLLKILEVVENDPEQLFRDLNQYNSYAEQMRQTFIDALLGIHRGLKE